MSDAKSRPMIFTNSMRRDVQPAVERGVAPTYLQSAFRRAGGAPMKVRTLREVIDQDPLKTELVGIGMNSLHSAYEANDLCTATMEN